MRTGAGDGLPRELLMRLVATVDEVGRHWLRSIAGQHSGTVSFDFDEASVSADQSPVPDDSV